MLSSEHWGGGGGSSHTWPLKTHTDILKEYLMPAEEATKREGKKDIYTIQKLEHNAITWQWHCPVTFTTSLCSTHLHFDPKTDKNSVKLHLMM